MSTEKGWIKLHRDIRDHWLWRDELKLKWWLDLLMSVNHDDDSVNIGMDLIICKRGQSVVSLSNWAKRWKISIGRAKRFLKLLEKDGMVHIEDLKKTTRITICNYDNYQSRRNEDGTGVDGVSERERKENVTGVDDKQELKELKELKEIEESFEFFFDEYHRITRLAKTDKKAALKKWRALTKAERIKAVENISLFYDSLENKKYCKKARTYLEDKNFNDEFASSLFPLTIKQYDKPKGKIRQ